MNVEQALSKLKEAGVTDSIQTVRRWLREGKIKATRSEFRKAGYLIDHEDLQRFINQRTGKDKDNEIEELRKEIEMLKKQRDLYQYFVSNTISFESENLV
ncbi:helix-turn-helix domain-containing protein [Anaerobacillus sp. MEB173]|uniref:helix-turn-helix domain-containing protein n=1 Tax=Anaerobacillus sp. MEB173 TaxID=3383345 RepID=UPI003F919671